MILDIVLIAIVIVFMYFGRKRGFVRTFRNLCSFILSIIIALLTYSKITEFISNSPVGDFIREKLFDSVGTSNMDLSSLPDFLQTPLETGVTGVAETISSNMATMVISILSIIITILVVKLLLNILFKALDLFAKLPVLKQFNRILGLVSGAVNGYFWMCIALYAVTYLSNIPSAHFLKEIIEASKVAAFLNENNPLVWLFPVIK